MVGATVDEVGADSVVSLVALGPGLVIVVILAVAVDHEAVLDLWEGVTPNPAKGGLFFVSWSTIMSLDSVTWSTTGRWKTTFRYSGTVGPASQIAGILRRTRSARRYRS